MRSLEVSAMPRIKGDIVIDRPTAEVFDFVADQRNEPAYNRQMLTSRMLTPGPVGAGSRFAAVHRGRRRPMELQIELTEYQRPRRLASTTTMTRGQVLGVLTFEPAGSATRMHWDWNLPLSGIAKLASPLVKAIGSRQERACWQALKDHLESSRPPQSSQGAAGPNTGRKEQTDARQRGR